MNSGRPRRINADTKIKELLAVNQDLVIDALVALNKNFSKLKNPVLRKLFAGRVTIADACKVGGCSITDFLLSMKNIGFEIDQTESHETPLEVEDESEAFQKDGAIELDVRPILAEGKDPLKIILQSVKELADGQSLKLINTFEPIPLFDLLAEKGFVHYTEKPAPDVVVTYFKKRSGTAVLDPNLGASEGMKQFDEVIGEFSPGKLIEVDVRSLEMPKPMLLIMEKTGQLKSGEALFVYHKKVPVYLLPQLTEKGFDYAIKHLSEGEVHLLIYKQ